MKPSPFPWSLLLATACELASAAGVPAASASSPASAACPAHAGASQVGRATSKVRHIPAEGDPCVSSNGLAKPVPH